MESWSPTCSQPSHRAARGDDLRLAIYLKLPEGGADVMPPQARFNGGAPLLNLLLLLCLIWRRSVAREASGITGAY